VSIGQRKLARPVEGSVMTRLLMSLREMVRCCCLLPPVLVSQTVVLVASARTSLPSLLNKILEKHPFTGKPGLADQTAVLFLLAEESCECPASVQLASWVDRTKLH
jgi:hypothetical protein